jgi:NAD+ kinase
MQALFAAGVVCSVTALFNRTPGRQRMASVFASVGLISRRDDPDILDSVAAVRDSLVRHGTQVVLESATASMLGDDRSTVTSRDELGRVCDLIVVVGGDGSLLGVARDLAHWGTPVVGVNRGGLGFLADIAPDQLDTKLVNVLRGHYTAEDHFLLDARVYHDGAEGGHSPALNDVVVHLGGVSRMMEFSLWVDGEFVYEQRSDGLIVASPTGSTAYSLSAGGPIMHPSLDAIVIVPMFPHTLTARPIVVPGTSEIAIVVGDTGRAEVRASCDSQVEFDLASGDEIRIRKYHAPLRLLYPQDHSFYESCRSKLDWASRLGGARRRYAPAGD